MADLKITGLPPLAESSIQATDLLAVADLSATETKKVTVKDLIAAGVALIDAGDIPAAKVAMPFATNSVATATIQDDAITSAKLATDSVTADAVAANAIGASELANNAVDSGALVTNSVTTAKITDLNVTADKLASNSVTTVKIADNNVTYAKLNLSDGDIPGAKITGNSITNAQIGADAVGASELADDAVDTNAIADSAVTNAKLANASISLGGVSISLGETDATPSFNLTDSTNYPAASLSGTISNAQLTGSITGDKLANTTVTYAKLNISDGDIAGAKITGNSITAAQIAANAVTASELADDAVDTAAVADAAITTAKIAANTIEAGNLAANSVGASELANNSVDTAAVIDGAITTAKIADGAVTTAKLSGTISAGTITDGAVGTVKLADDAVTSAKLAPNAVDTTAVANAAITNDKVATGISGTKISDGTITAAKLNTSNLDRSLNVASGNLGINNAVSAATRSGITYNAQGLITATVALAAADLPLATSSAVGGVSVGTGLSVNGAGALSLTNSVTGATVSGITFNNQGMITAATGLTAANLPVATTSAKGAVQITSGGGLTVDGSGNLTTSTSGISAGTYQSITVNNKGIATAGAALTAGLIPSLPASKITTGTLDAARIAADSIDSSKLSNSSTTIIQSIAQNGYPTAAFTGQLLFDPIAEDAYLWDGNAWNPITTLTKGALVRLGTYNANLSQVDYVTAAGSAAGLTVGQNLPVASESVDGGYVVISVQGTPSGVAGITGQLAPPDYLLGVTASATSSSWVEIDLSTTVASQQASAISYTPYGQLSATNVQAVINEIEDEKLAKAGGTVSGELLIGNAGSLVFEGATADAFETKLTVADPTTSDKVITLPDITGTVITTGDTGTVTGTMLANDTIQNTDIKSDAAIAYSKLAALTSAQILVGNGSNVATGVAVTGDISIDNAGLTAIASGVIVDSMVSGSASITGSKVSTGTTSAVGVLQLTDSTSSTSTTTAGTPNAIKSAYDLANTANTTANAAVEKTGDTMTGNLILDNAKEIRFSEADSNGANYIALKAPDAVTSDVTLTLPASAPTANQVLKANASTPTTLEWATDTTNTAAADLTGTTLASNVVASSLTSVGTLTSLTVSGTITGTASQASTVNVTAENNVAATVYPLFAGNGATATGYLTPSTDTGFTYNSSTGDLTATKFTGSGASLTNLNATNLASGTVAAARLGSGSSVTTKFLRGDNTWQTVSVTSEGTSILSTGESSSTKYLGTDGDGTCSWKETNFVRTDNASSSSGQLEMTMGGAFPLKINNTNDAKISLQGSNNPYIQFREASANKAEIAWSTDGYLKLNNTEDGSQLRIKDDLSFSQDGSTFYSVLTTDYISNFADNRLVTASGSSTFNGESNLTFDGTDLTLAGGLSINHGTGQTPVPLTITGSGAGGTKIELKGSTEPRITYYEDTTLKAYLIWQQTAGEFIIQNAEHNHLFSVGATPRWSSSNGSSWTEILHQGNVGSGGALASSAIHAASLTLSGDLTVNGTTTTIDTTNLNVTDKNITLGNVSTPTDATADGGGITLLGSSDKTFNWVDSTDAWTSSEHIKVASGKTFIGDGSTLTALNASNIASGTIAAARVPTLNQDTSGTAEKATRVIVSASSDTTAFPLFVQAATGNLTPHAQTNFQFNATSGVLSCSGFSGSGASLTNVNATTLDGIGSGSFLRGDSSDTASGDIEFTGGAGAITIGGNSDIRFNNGTWSGNITTPKITAHDNALYICGGSSGIRFRYNSGDRWKIEGSGHFLPSTDDTFNIGESSTRVSNVYAARFYGDGSNLTNLPSSGGSVDLTASGAIAANKPVFVNSSGQAVQVATPADTTGSGSYQRSGNSGGIKNASNGAGQFVSLSSDGGDIRARVATISGTTISWGTEVQVANGSGGYDNFDVCYVKQRDCYMMAYNKSTSDLWVRCFTVSGTSITVGTESQMSNQLVTRVSIANATDSASGWCSVWSFDEAQNRLWIRTYKPADTITNAVGEGNTSYYGGMSGTTNTSVEYNPDQQRFYGIFYYHPQTAIQCESWTCAESNGGISTAGHHTISSSILHDGGYGWMRFGLTYSPTIKKMLVSYMTGSGSGSGKIRTLTHSSGVYTTGTETTLGSNYDHMILTYHESTETQWLMFTQSTASGWNNNGSGPLRLRKVTVNASTEAISLGSTTTIDSGDYFKQDICAGTDGLLLGSVDTDNSNYPESWFYKIGMTNLTDENFVGFADAAISSGSSGSINVVGNTTTQSGLTPGQKYYVQGDGTIGTSPSSPSVVAGLALSSTKLLIKNY